MKKYTPREIEGKWQKTWEDSGIYQATEDPSRPKKYVLEYFPYPSGAAMHVGHVRNYTIGDAMARFYRMQGFNVMHPMGWDAFGLPAENFAIKNNISPQQAIAQNTARFKQQLTQMGFSYDWSREINSSDPNYYKWTQWFFNLLLERGLAYQKDSLQWWCDTDKTVLANEQVEAGKCWRCGNEVTKKPLKQWFFKITDYADRLSDDLEKLDWTESIKSMQRNWIGKSEGAEIEFNIGKDYKISDSLKFTPELTELVKSGKKTSTFRLEAKNLNDGDYVKFITRFNDHETSAFGIGKITGVSNKKIKDIPIDYDGHEKFYSKEEQLGAYKHYYGDEVTFNTELIIYEFEYITDIITVFTTRPDTLFGATFMVLAPEHPLVSQITTKEQKSKVEKYIKQAQAKSDIERQETDREKTGVFTGAYAINPVNNEKIPIWIADYVLYGYGTGAIMAVPAHDERDFEFAKKFDLPIVNVINPQHIRDDAAGKVVDVDKNKIVAVVINNKNELLTINWGKKFGGRLFIGGTLEEGEDAKETALREVTEETGYTDLELLEEGQEVYDYTYFAFSKNETHHTRVKFYFIRLKSDAKQAQNLDESEKDKFKVEWVTKQIADNEITEPLHKYAFDKFVLGQCFHDEGILTNSDKYDGLESANAREKIVADLEKSGAGKEVVNYRIRDWLISRQRYWGAPIPIIHCIECGAVPVPKKDLPVVLPEVTNYQPTAEGKSVLASVDDWVNTTCPKCQGPAKRETDTMDGFACSSWYFLRFADPNNNTEPFSKEKAKFWEPVDDYIGGAEHAVMHLLYARMWTKVMFDAGLIDFDEPFLALRNQGMILAPDGRKMSKSWGNVIAPDELIEQGYGADSIRVMELFIGPWDQKANWSIEGMGGCYRFLNRSWNIVQEYLESKNAAKHKPTEDASLKQFANRAIKKVTIDLHNMGFNTAIAALMQYVNELFKIKDSQGFINQEDWQFACESLVLLLSPFAPHIAEELWQQLGKEGSVHVAPWPQYDEGYLVEHVVKIAVQVNGKLRGEIEVEQGTTQDVIEAEAKKHPNVAQHIKNDPKKVIYVPNKIINFVV